MQADGFRVGYFKPLGTQPREVHTGQYYDEDALFARQVLGLSEPVETLAPICLSPQFIEQQFAGSSQDLTTVVVEAFNAARQDKDTLPAWQHPKSPKCSARPCWLSSDTMAMCR
jgi:hypothetical protein